MRYLYGDSSPSPLQSNYLAFVRDAMEFCVHLLLAQERITTLREERNALDRYTEAERARIIGLKALVIDAANEANHDGAESLSLHGRQARHRLRPSRRSRRCGRAAEEARLGSSCT